MSLVRLSFLPLSRTIFTSGASGMRRLTFDGGRLDNGSARLTCITCLANGQRIVLQADDVGRMFCWAYSSKHFACHMLLHIHFILTANCCLTSAHSMSRQIGHCISQMRIARCRQSGAPGFTPGLVAYPSQLIFRGHDILLFCYLFCT